MTQHNETNLGTIVIGTKQFPKSKSYIATYVHGGVASTNTLSNKEIQCQRKKAPKKEILCKHQKKAF
jgi:hypothetical protein